MGAEFGLRKGIGEGGRSLDEGDGLIAGNIESSPTARVRAGDLAVHPDQVVGRFGELHLFEIGGPGGDIPFLGAPQPANLELGCLAAFRADVGGRLHLRSLGVKIPLIHPLQCNPNGMVKSRIFFI